MSVQLASSPKQLAEETTPTTVTYDGRRVYNVEPEPSHEVSIHRNFDTPLTETERNVRDLHNWPEKWNGYDAAKPNHDSISHAYSWIVQLYRDLSAKLWIKPHVIADADGDIVFEWWNNQKKLTVYVSPETVEYIKVEGPDIYSDMEDGIVETPQDSRMLWHWLTS